MHIAASLMTVMARPSCRTVRLFSASHCHVLTLRPALPNRRLHPRPGQSNGHGAVPQGGGDRHLATVPHGVVGDRVPWGGERQGGGGVALDGSEPCIRGVVSSTVK